MLPTSSTAHGGWHSFLISLPDSDVLSPSHPAPQECLKPKELQCATFAPQLPGSFNSLDGPCTSCSSATVPVYATNEGIFQFAGGPRHPAALLFAATA